VAAALPGLQAQVESLLLCAAWQVWGLTAAILINVAQLAFAEEAAFVVQDEGAVCVSKIHMRYGEPAVGSPPRIAGEGPQMLDD